MLIVDGPQGRLLRQEPDGTLATVADLTALGRPPFNELVVDATGTAYVNGGPGIVRVRRDGSMRAVADGCHGQRHGLGRRWPHARRR